MFFYFNSIDRIAIRWALKKSVPWDVDSKKSPFRTDPRAKRITGLKKRLKIYHLKKQGQRCCYCRTLLKGRSIETDREHIVQKELFRELSFHPFNLSVACKTCNMTNKSTKTIHLRGYRRNSKLYSKNLTEIKNYNIVHPNIHNWQDHIKMKMKDDGISAVLHYRPLTSRGWFTYKFFNLHALEIHQNVQEQKGPTTKKISRNLHPKVIGLERTHNQRET